MHQLQVLFDEHDNVLRMLAIVHKISLQSLQGKVVPVDELRQVIAFIREYADKTHHGKEEVYLFDAMIEHLGPIAEKLIKQGMLVEHDMGRWHVYDLEQALNRYEETESDDDKLAILIALGSYEQLLRRHIQKENDALFTFAEKNLPEPILSGIVAQMNTYEAEEENRSVRQKHLAFLFELEKKYA